MSNKPKIFVVTRTPKALDNILSVKPDVAAAHYCAVINVSDSPCASFDYQLKVPSFWFPINEAGEWGHSPFYGALRVVNEYYKGDKPVLIHCHAGANRSPSVAFAILLAKGYTLQEAEESLNYPNMTQVFERNLERKHIPKNIISFLKKAEEIHHANTSLYSVLRNLDSDYEAWTQKRFEEQNDYVLKADSENPTRLVYNKEKKRFILVREEPIKTEEPWVEPKFERKDWYVTPLKDETNV